MINRNQINSSSINAIIYGLSTNSSVPPSLPEFSENVTNIPVNPIAFPAAHIRFFHAAPQSPDIDIYANGSLSAQNLRYGDFSAYADILPGVYTITVYSTGQVSNPLLTYKINTQRNSITTFAIIGDPGALSILPITDQPQNASPSLAYLRFVHLSPNITTVDIYMNHILVITDMNYKEISNYLSVPNEQYNITIRSSQTNAVIASAENIHLQAGSFFTCYLVGYIGEAPGAELLIPLEGTSYFTF